MRPGKQLCDPPASVEGRLVISDGKFAQHTSKDVTCLLSVAFDRLSEAKAAGYIFLAPWAFQGITMFWHDEWDMTARRSSPMPVVELPSSYALNTGKSIAEELAHHATEGNDNLKIRLHKNHYKVGVLATLHACGPHSRPRADHHLRTRTSD